MLLNDIGLRRDRASRCTHEGERRPLGRVLVAVVHDHSNGSFTHFRGVTGLSWHEKIPSEDSLSNFPVRLHLHEAALTAVDSRIAKHGSCPLC